jgi:hypothetical protein
MAAAQCWRASRRWISTVMHAQRRPIWSLLIPPVTPPPRCQHRRPNPRRNTAPALFRDQSPPRPETMLATGIIAAAQDQSRTAWRRGRNGRTPCTWQHRKGTMGSCACCSRKTSTATRGIARVWCVSIQPSFLPGVYARKESTSTWLTQTS